MKTNGWLLLALVGCKGTPATPPPVTAVSTQGGETAYTTLRAPGDTTSIRPPAPEGGAFPAKVENYTSRIDLAATGEVELVLIDPAGRRTGQAGADAPEWREIPESGSDCDYISDDSDSGGGDTPHVLEVWVNSADSGRYELDLYGTGDGPFEVTIRLHTAMDQETVIESLRGTVTKRSRGRYAFILGREAPSPDHLDTLPDAPR